MSLEVVSLGEEKQCEAPRADITPPGHTTTHSLANEPLGLGQRIGLLQDPFVERFPLEISTTIFGFCLPKQCHTLLPEEMLDGQVDNASTLFAMGGVCKAWRQIVLSIPRFWSHIFIPIRRSSIDVTSVMIKDWIDRSATTPLSIAVYYLHGNDTDTQWYEKVKLLGEIINTTSNRWQSLDLKLPAALIPFFEGNPSNLLELRISNTDPVHFNLSTPDALITSGSGKPAPMYAMIDTYSPRSINAVWDNVTSVLLKSCTVEDCLELLRLAPKLVDCMFAMYYEEEDEEESILIPVFHHNLESLRIYHPASYGTTTKILDCCTFPQLVQLLIYNPGEVLPVPNILSLISRSACQPYIMQLNAIRISEEPLIFLLLNMPWLEELQLIFNEDSGCTLANLFKLLAATTLFVDKPKEENATDSHPNFLPELQVLKSHIKSAVECEQLWDIIPDLFGSGRTDITPHIRERPFEVLSLTYSPPWHNPSLPNPGYISKHTLDRIGKLWDRDIEINIQNGDSSETLDFIQSSYEHHFPEIQEVQTV